MGNQKKSEQLGLPYGTAMARLRKMVLFDLLVRCEENICFHCETPIKTVTELSMEHKEPWLDVDTDLFWDIDNIAFSHLVCNTRAARSFNGQKQECPYGHPYDEKNTRYGPTGFRICRECGKRYKRKYRKKKAILG